jgi:MFS family permease
VIAFFGFLGSLAAGRLPAMLLALSGGGLGETEAIRLTLHLSPIMFLLGAFLFYKIRPAMQVGASQKTGTRGAVPLGLMIFYFLVVFLQTAGNGAPTAFLNIYLETDLAMSTSQIGNLMGIIQLVPVAFAIIAPVFIGWLGTAGTLTLTLFGTTAGAFILAGFQNPMAAALGLICSGMMNMVLLPARNLFGQEIVPLGWRTPMSAISTIGLGLGWGMIAIFGGSLVPQIGFQGLFYTSASLSLLSSLIMLAYIVRRILTRNRQTTPEVDVQVTAE